MGSGKGRAEFGKRHREGNVKIIQETIQNCCDVYRSLSPSITLYNSFCLHTMGLLFLIYLLWTDKTLVPFDLFLVFKVFHFEKTLQENLSQGIFNPLGLSNCFSISSSLHSDSYNVLFFYQCSPMFFVGRFKCFINTCNSLINFYYSFGEDAIRPFLLCSLLCRSL